MCDDLTDAENDRYLSRRRLGLGVAAAALLVGCGARVGAVEKSSQRAIRARRVVVPTPDGEADGLFVSPDAGQHPGVLLWPDVAGLRPAYERMATRLAEAGYAVLAINPYYRSAKAPILDDFAAWRTEEGQARIAPMREALVPEAVARDGAALVAWLDQQPEVDKARKIGAQGYCMSGSFTFRAAAAAPDRVGALASFHGGGLATEAPDSPHRLFEAMRAAALICVAQNDDARDPDAKDTLRAAALAAGRDAEIEVYPANHGWCTLDSPVYDEAQAERAWARLLATYAAHL